MHQLKGRGRVSKWSKEQVDRLTTAEIRALLENAERLREPEIAAMCNELLDARPHGRPPARRPKNAPKASTLVARSRAFEMHGVSPRSRVWSRGGIKTNGDVLLAVRADEMQHSAGLDQYLLWSPNTAGAHPWSDSPGGQERLEHCRIAAERGAAEGLLVYGKRAEDAPGNEGNSTDRIDAGNLLSLRIEKRGEEFWASCAPQKRPAAVHE